MAVRPAGTASCRSDAAASGLRGGLASLTKSKACFMTHGDEKRKPPTRKTRTNGNAENQNAENIENGISSIPLQAMGTDSAELRPKRKSRRTRWNQGRTGSRKIFHTDSTWKKQPPCLSQGHWIMTHWILKRNGLRATHCFREELKNDFKSLPRLGWVGNRMKNPENVNTLIHKK